MSPSKNTKPDNSKTVVLSADHRLPIFIFLSGFLLIPFPFFPWPTILISSFGFFLLIQSFTLKLKFTPEDLIVLQLGKELRKFPLKNWLSWRLFLPGLPGIFYFREKASPHLLPILFNPETLKEQLKMRVGDLEVPTKE